MIKKFRQLTLFCMILLVIFTLFGFINVVTAPEPAPTMAIAEYDYYVVAGHQMKPTLPLPAPQPSGFTCTFALGAFWIRVYSIV